MKGFKMNKFVNYNTINKFSDNDINIMCLNQELIHLSSFKNQDQTAIDAVKKELRTCNGGNSREDEGPEKENKFETAKEYYGELKELIKNNSSYDELYILETIK